MPSQLALHPYRLKSSDSAKGFRQLLCLGLFVGLRRRVLLGIEGGLQRKAMSAFTVIHHGLEV